MLFCHLYLKQSSWVLSWTVSLLSFLIWSSYVLSVEKKTEYPLFHFSRSRPMFNTQYLLCPHFLQTVVLPGPRPWKRWSPFTSWGFGFVHGVFCSSPSRVCIPSPTNLLLAFITCKFFFQYTSKFWFLPQHLTCICIILPQWTMLLS